MAAPRFGRRAPISTKPRRRRALTRQDTASYGPLALRLTSEACGLGCLVFGSDAPVMDAHAAAAAVEAAGITEAALRLNAGRLFS